MKYSCLAARKLLDISPFWQRGICPFCSGSFGSALRHENFSTYPPFPKRGICPFCSGSFEALRHEYFSVQAALIRPYGTKTSRHKQASPGMPVGRSASGRQAGEFFFLFFRTKKRRLKAAETNAIEGVKNAKRIFNTFFSRPNILLSYLLSIRCRAGDTFLRHPVFSLLPS